MIIVTKRINDCNRASVSGGGFVVFGHKTRRTVR
jgi:hypothetical protein